ncbi:uncharacterized protein LOC107848980 [Capsicum annuum]|uniref:uncharacterized protein LOC107848980 n=1 Tax=Capsicum annuum TaxID=4072 RepID=UPI0007BF901F|nr:uncharacterized protein LOC107848980 [Capsicum annuum]
MNRLYTKDRLVKWHIQISEMCVFCGNEVESTEHLFFRCHYTTGIWNALLGWMKIQRVALPWSSKIMWIESHIKGRSAASHIFRMVLAASVYYIWKERNCRIFRSSSATQDKVVRLVIQDVICLAVTRYDY